MKGHLLLPIVEEISRLIVAKKVATDELEVSLETDDLDLLHCKLDPGVFYSAASYARLTAFVDERLKRRRRADWIKHGRERYEMLSSLEEFRQQFNPLDRWPQTFGFFGMTLWSSFYNFLHWELEPGTRTLAYCYEISGANRLPERERYRLQGFAQSTSS